MRIIKTNIFNQQRGSILVTAVITILFISGVVIGLMYWLWAESKQTTQKKLSAKALYAAETGVQVALERLQRGGMIGVVDYDDFVDTSIPGDNTNFNLQTANAQVRVTIQEVP